MLLRMVSAMSDCVTEIYRAGYNDGRKERDYDPQSHEITFELQCYIVTLEAALTEAYRVILHELDNGRTPYLLPVDNGGKGLGYFEDVLAGIKS
jgi:hypothetical protein